MYVYGVSPTTGSVHITVMLMLMTYSMTRYTRNLQYNRVDFPVNLFCFHKTEIRLQYDL